MMEIYRFKIELLSDYHTTGERHGSMNDVLYNHDKTKLLIPGTQVKGMLHSELNRLQADNNILGSLFGFEEQEGKGDYKEPRLKFTDASAPVDVLVERTHVKVDRDTMSAEEHGLYTERTVPRGVTFSGYILVKKCSLSESEKKLLEGAAKSASHYGFGASRSRGLGRIDMTFDWQHPISKDDYVQEMKGANK